MIRQLLVLTAIMILLVSCTSTTQTPIAVSPTETPTVISTTETPVSCQPSKVLESQIGFGEIKGDMQSEGELWALLFFKTAWTKADQKIIWRVTGEGDVFKVQAQNEFGTIIEPVWKEYHDSSNWERPGN
jgi:hypothetical protein